jgi:hypothetical protein
MHTLTGNDAATLTPSVRQHVSSYSAAPEALVLIHRPSTIKFTAWALG